MVKMAGLDGASKWQKLISRKIWVAGKSSNFHTVLNLPIGLATTPGNSVSIATYGYFWMIWHIVLNSSSRLCAQTSRIPHSSLVVGPEAADKPPAACPFVTPIWTLAGLIFSLFLRSSASFKLSRSGEYNGLRSTEYESKDGCTCWFKSVDENCTLWAVLLNLKEWVFIMSGPWGPEGGKCW